MISCKVFKICPEIDLMRNRYYLDINSGSIWHLIKFMLASYDGLFVLIVGCGYFLWGILSAFSIFNGGWLGSDGLFLLPIVMVVVFISHRRATYSDDQSKAFFCLLGEIAIAGIPFWKNIGRLF